MTVNFERCLIEKTKKWNEEYKEVICKMASGEGSVKLTGDEIQFMKGFSQITGVMPWDCVIEGDRLIFVVKEGKVGQVIGKGGANIKQVKDVFQREVNVVEYAATAESFVRNALAPANIKKVSIVENKNGKTVSIVDVSPEDRGRAIGKNGRNIERARILVKRHFGIEDIILA